MSERERHQTRARDRPQLPISTKTNILVSCHHTAMSRRHQPPPQPAGPPTLARTQLPVDQLHTLQNRLAQLIRSIAEFEKALVSSQGLEEW